MGKWLKKVFVLLGIFIVTLQPFFVPVVHAVESWTGNPWEGESWEGSPWDGSDLKWQGETWQSENWEGNSTNGPESWNSQNWNGLPWYLDGWNQDGSNADPWSNDGFSGDGTPNGAPWNMPGYRYGPGGIGNPWLGSDFNGDGTNGDNFDGNPTDGIETDGDTTEGNPTSLEDFPSLPFGYDVGKYIVNDVMMGQVNLAGDLLTSQNMRDLGYNSSMKYGLGYRGSLLMNGLKLGVGDNVFFDAYDTYSHVGEGVGAIQDYRSAKQLYDSSSTVGDLAEAGRSVSNTTPPAASVGALSKFNVAAAAVGTGISAFETGFNTAKAVDVVTSDASGADKTVAVTDATASFGDTLMNAGVVTSAIPGAQAVGAGMVAVGAGVWAVSKGVNFVASHWKGNWKDTGKAMWKSTKDTAKKAWDTVTGWFS